MRVVTLEKMSSNMQVDCVGILNEQLILQVDFMFFLADKTVIVTVTLQKCSEFYSTFVKIITTKYGLRRKPVH